MRTRVVIGIGLVVGAFTLAVVLLPLRAWVTALVGWIHDAGALGIAVFVAAYVGAALLVLPAPRSRSARGSRTGRSAVRSS